MGLVNIEVVLQVDNAESNGHVADDVTRPLDVIVCLATKTPHHRG